MSDLESTSGKAPPVVRFTAIKGRDHFSVLAPANIVLAKKILNDKGPRASPDLSDAELDAISPGRRCGGGGGGPRLTGEAPVPLPPPQDAHGDGLD